MYHGMGNRMGGWALLAAGLCFSGCADSPRVVMLATHPTVAQLQAARGVEPGYVYYPDYELYYSRNYEQYVFRYNHAWMHQTRPPEAIAGDLAAARSVPMNFRDDPVRHHAEISRLYPRSHPRPQFDLAAIP
ncbi:MAG: hypothetical protein JWQ83_627 [Lacunisphaera sp.]|nr:hypothetical protein [Lacunisphaera sp.]MDB6165487.1 hypothetical protein [Lacunisphaera sp.]